jgi:uncharacterized membrane protein YqjE
MGFKSQFMGPNSYFRGKTGLLVALGVVVILLIALPAYRWFFLISLAVGIVVALILHFWNRYRPVKEEDVDNKRPLGLS